MQMDNNDCDDGGLGNNIGVMSSRVDRSMYWNPLRSYLQLGRNYA